MKSYRSTNLKNNRTLILFLARYAKGVAQASRGLKMGVSLQ
jgi:hypothetical protein